MPVIAYIVVLQSIVLVRMVAVSGERLLAFWRPLWRRQPQIVSAMHEALVGLAEMDRILADANFSEWDAGCLVDQDCCSECYSVISLVTQIQRSA